MSFLERIKLLLLLRKVVNQMSAFLQKFDGLKTILGLSVVTAYFALPYFGIQAPHVILTTGLTLTGVGVTHKFEKAFGLVTKVLLIGHKVLDGIQAAMDAIKANDASA